MARQRKPSQKSQPTSEEALVARAMSGDPDAFGQLWATYSPNIRNWLSKELKPDAIDDVLQQAATNAWERHATFDETKGDFGAWLFGIARNAACEFAKRRQERTNRDDVIDATSKGDTSEGGGTSENDVGKENSDVDLAMRKIMSSFSTVDQKIFWAGIHHDKGERWAAKLATELGLKAARVRTTFDRIHKKVRDKLSDQGFSAFGGDAGDREIRVVLTRLVEKVLGLVGPIGDEDLHRIISGDGMNAKQEHPTSPEVSGRAQEPREFISTGLRPLNTLLGGRGLVQGSSVIIRGQPGTGKTTLGLQIAKHAIDELDHTVVYASVEDDPEILLNQVTRSFWDCDYGDYFQHRDRCFVEDFTRYFDRDVAGEAERESIDSWRREAGLTRQELDAIPSEIKDRLFSLHCVQQARLNARRKVMKEMDVDHVMTKLWTELDVGNDRPVLLVIDSLNALINSAAARFRKVPERQIMLKILHSLRNWRARRGGKVTVLFLVEDDVRVVNAAASYAADVVIDLQQPTMEHTIYESPGQTRMWQQEMRFCKVRKGRGLPIQSRSCCYEFDKDKDPKLSGIVFLPTFAASGLVSLFQENRPMQDVIRTLRESDVPSLYPQVVVQEFNRTALQRVFSASRRRTRISLRHPMMLSNVDEYWLTLLQQNNLLEPIPADKLEVFSLPLVDASDSANGTRFIKELAAAKVNVYSGKNAAGQATDYYGVPQIANIGMMIYRKDVLLKIKEHPPVTWEDVERICLRLKTEFPDEPNKLFLELTSYDTFLATALELGWGHGAFWQTVREGHNLRITFDDESGLVKLIAAMMRLKRWIHSMKITPRQCSVDPILNDRKDWVFARHWYSTWIDVCTQDPPVTPPDATYGVIPIPISDKYKRHEGESAKHHSAWGEWYLAILRGSENIELGIDLINNLMTARKISERARSGAALPTVERFYEITDEICPKTDYSFNQIRTKLFADAKSRSDFADYPRFARSFSAVLQTLATNSGANVVEAVRKAFGNIDPAFPWPKNLEQQLREFVPSEFDNTVHA